MKESYVKIVGELWSQLKEPNGGWRQPILQGRRKITKNFTYLLVDALQSNTVDISTFYKHAVGTGIGNESADDIALINEIMRVDGSQGEQLGNENVYETIATFNFTSDYTITEHGLFNTNNILADRTYLSSSIPVTNGTIIVFTYRMIFSFGG